MTPMHTASVDQLVEDAMEQGSIPGLALAVLQEGHLLHAKGYGLANLEHRVPVTEHTVFKLASVTKTFTATAIMMLVEQGMACLDDPINQYLADPPSLWGKLTLRHLLTHTSGIRNYEPLLHASWHPDDSHEKVVKLVSEQPLQFQPGEVLSYCNTNYVLLGALIEPASGQPYREFIRDQILWPLGMSETYWNDDAEIIPNRAQGYAWDSETLQSPGHPPLRHIEKPCRGLWNYGDGGLLSSVADLARWDAGFSSEKLLSRSSNEQMWTPARLRDGTAVEYGLGWIVKEVQEHRTVGHWGRNPGFMAEFSRYVDDGLTVIVLCNRWKADLGSLASRLAAVYLPDLMPSS